VQPQKDFLRRVASQFGMRQQPRYAQHDSRVACHNLLKRRQISSLGALIRLQIDSGSAVN